MLKFIGSTFLLCWNHLKPAVPSAIPCAPGNEAKEQFGSSALSSSLAGFFSGSPWTYLEYTKIPRHVDYGVRYVFFYGSMEYIATLKWPHQKRIISERNHARRGLGPCLGLTIVNPADEYWDWDLKPQGLDGSITEAKLLNKRYPRICLDCSLDRRDSHAKPMDFGVFGVVFSSQPIWKSWQFWPWLLYHIVPPINP